MKTLGELLKNGFRNEISYCTVRIGGMAKWGFVEGTYGSYVIELVAAATVVSWHASNSRRRVRSQKQEAGASFTGAPEKGGQ